jgi:hypothetical protein
MHPHSGTGIEEGRVKRLTKSNPPTRSPTESGRAGSSATLAKAEKATQKLPSGSRLGHPPFGFYVCSTGPNRF